MEKTEKNLFKLKITVFTILVLLLVLIHWLSPGFFPKVWELSTSGNIDGTIEFLQSFGMWAIVISILIDILINTLGFLPSIFISTANGVLFGIVTGVLISWIAESIGVILSFILMKTILRDYAEALLGKSAYLKKIDEYSGKNGFKMMLFARSLPYFPSGVITALGALSRISFWDYVGATFIGKLPSTALEVIIGHDVINYEQNLSRLALLVLGVAIVYGGLIWYEKRRNKKQPSNE